MAFNVPCHSAMNRQHLRNKLETEEQQLASILQRLAETTRSAAADRTTGDFADQATTERDTAEAVEESSVVSRALEQVRDALRRLSSDAYGKCSACGEPIDNERLEAVPWTRYCQHDQELRDMEPESATSGPEPALT